MENYFSVLPVSQNFDLEPGKIYEGVIKVVNPVSAKGDFNYAAVVTPYSVVDEDYTADLSTKSNYNMITDWITIENPQGSVKPNEVAEIKFKIEVPVDAPAGGQYAAITVRSDSSKQSQSDGVSVQNYYEIASLIYAKVAGQTKREGEVLSNSVPGFVTSLPVQTSVQVKNDGNVHEQLNSKISIKNALTGEMIFPVEDDKDTFQDVIMPGSERYVKRNLSRLPALGIFEVTQDVTYLGKTYPLTQTVIVCPLWFLILAVLTILAFVGTIATIIRRNIKHKRAMSM